MSDNKFKKISEDTIYFVESDDDTTLVAMDLVTDGSLISWFDTVKRRMMGIEEVIDSNPEHFIFKRREGEGGYTYQFIPLTIDIYNSRVKDKLLVPKVFADEKTLFEALRKTKEEAW